MIKGKRTDIKPEGETPLFYLKKVWKFIKTYFEVTNVPGYYQAAISRCFLFPRISLPNLEWLNREVKQDEKITDVSCATLFEF